MANADIDPDTGYPEDVARRPGAPFPDDRIPTQKTELESPDGKADAFDGEGAGAGKVEDAAIEDATGGEVPVTPTEAAAVLAADGKVAKEYKSGKSSESVDEPTVQPVAKSDEKSEAKDESKDDESDASPRRGRRTTRTRASE